MASTICEVIWLRWLLQDLGVGQQGPATLMCDNEFAHHIGVNLVYHEHMKHIKMD